MLSDPDVPDTDVTPLAVLLAGVHPENEPRLPAPVIELDDYTPGPDVWFRSESLRNRLHRATGRLDVADLGGLEGLDLVESTREMLRLLTRSGHVERDANARWRLTKEGAAWRGRAGAPKPSRDSEITHAANMARAISDLYSVEHYDMLTNETDGKHAFARARLCAALANRGWALGRIERHFGMRSGMAKDGCARWAREKRS
jgi:hypothetical protein